MKKEKNKTENSTSNLKQTNNKRNANRWQKADEDNAKTICPKCNKTHFGDCLKGTRKCFNYGESGHIRKYCPKPKEAKE